MPKTMNNRPPALNADQRLDQLVRFALGSIRNTNWIGDTDLQALEDAFALSTRRRARAWFVCNEIIWLLTSKDLLNNKSDDSLRRRAVLVATVENFAEKHRATIFPDSYGDFAVQVQTSPLYQSTRANRKVVAHVPATPMEATGV